MIQRLGGGVFRVLGPAPAPLGKLRGEYRAQLLIKGTNRKAMREAVAAAISARTNESSPTVALHRLTDTQRHGAGDMNNGPVAMSGG